jgi:hypothetical protein
MRLSRERLFLRAPALLAALSLASAAAAQTAGQGPAASAPGSLGMLVYRSAAGPLITAAVGPGTPARLAGLKRGDLILTIGGESVGTVDDVARIISRRRAGDIVSVGYRRGSTERLASAALAPPARPVLSVTGKALPEPAEGKRSFESYTFQANAARGYLIVVRSRTPIWLEIREGPSSRSRVVAFGDGARGTTTSFQPTTSGAHLVTLQSAKAAEYSIQVLEFEQAWPRRSHLLDELSGKSFCAETALVWCYQFEPSGTGIRVRYTRSDGTLLADGAFEQTLTGGLTYSSRSPEAPQLQVRAESHELVTLSSPSGLNNWGVDPFGNLMILHNWGERGILEDYFTLRDDAYVADYNRRWTEAARLAAAREAERKAEQRAAFGQMFASAVAIAGVTAAGGDLSAVPLSGNPLEILNAAGAEAARQNERSQARFGATLAGGQRSAEGGAFAGSDTKGSAPAPVDPPSAVSRPAAPTSERRTAPPSGLPAQCTTKQTPDGLPSAWLESLAEARGHAEAWAARNCGRSDMSCSGPIMCKSINNFGVIKHSCVQPAMRTYTAYCGDGSSSRVSAQ